MAQATFDTPSLSCMSCMAKIEDALAPLEGVREADVDIAAQQVRVTFDEAATDRDAIAHAIREAGYDVAGVSA
jgi:copper ion binding protein